MGIASKLGSFFGFGGARTTTPVTKPAGSDGVYAPGGFIVGGERHPSLQGMNRWKSGDNVVANRPDVAAMARVWGALLGGAKWVVEENDRGGRKAERAADLVREGLIEAPMQTPWGAVVRKAGFGATFRGFAMSEQILRRRADGTWITDRLEERPQHTIERWDIPDEQQAWRGVWQRTASGAEYYVQRERLLYVVDDLLTADPTGVGILRHCTRSAEQTERLEQLEGWGFEFSLHGVPIGMAPLKELYAQGVVATNASSEGDPKVEAWVRGQVEFLNTFLQKHAKDPQLNALLDSATYFSADDKRTPSDVRKWDIKLLQLVASGQVEIRAAINAKSRERLRLLGMEWLAMGDGEGARSVHDGKTSMTGMIVNGTLEDIGAAASSGPAYRLVEMNMGKAAADLYAPRVYPEPVPMETVAEMCRALQLLAQAGAPLDPKDRDTIGNAVLERLRLPNFAEIDEADLLLPRMGPDGKPVLPGAGPPDPDKGEVDVELEDEPAAKPAKKGRPR